MSIILALKAELRSGGRREDRTRQHARGSVPASVLATAILGADHSGALYQKRAAGPAQWLLEISAAPGLDTIQGPICCSLVLARAYVRQQCKCHKMPREQYSGACHNARPKYVQWLPTAGGVDGWAVCFEHVKELADVILCNKHTQ